MMQLFETVCAQCSNITTQYYSSSFASAIRLLHKSIRQPIRNIYGFVRFADEIVDTFHQFDRAKLLSEFKNETYAAIERKISLNPVLNSFQQTVNRYNIDMKLIDAFFCSMELDLYKKEYDTHGYSAYIYGSAEVVGLMCLKVFCENDPDQYPKLIPFAKSLGAAFQKVNFLRDIKNDFEKLHRIYFPSLNFKKISDVDKTAIENDIQKDFDHAYYGITQLPVKARLGVYVAYKYYYSLFKKIKKTKLQRMLIKRIRIPGYDKARILATASFKNQFDIL